MNIKIKGEIHYILRDIDNNIIREGYEENLVTNTGMDIFLKCMTGQIKIGAVQRIALGSDSTPSSVLDTSLKSKILHIDTTPTISNNSLKYELFVPTGSVSSNTWVREIGLVHFDGSEKLVTRIALSGTKELLLTSGNTLALSYIVRLINNRDGAA